mgnify:CR=1 FL=1
MKKRKIESKIHKESLILLYKILIIFSFLTFVVNIINKRPFKVYILSIISFILLSFLYYLLEKKSKVYLSKIIFLSFYSTIYIPLAWITSPGSLSAMPFFSIFVLIIALLFIEKRKELIFPALVITETLILFYLEYFNLLNLKGFASSKQRILDISINYFLISITLFVILYKIIRYYLNQHQKVYLKSVMDDLTGVYNRRFLMKTLLSKDNEFIQNIDYYSIIMIDINNFKPVNDIYGHLEGDKVLRKLGQILLKNTRKYDICGRYGGDEFLVILPEVNKSEANNFCKRVTNEFEKYSKIYKKVDFSLSYGISNSKEKSVKEIIDLADRNLYQNKRNSC